MSKMFGIRCDVVGKDDVYYLLFYDIDREITEDEQKYIDSVCKSEQVSYLLYKTKHGIHLIGLTPLSIMKHARMFLAMKSKFNSYYGGIVIRWSRKAEETQILIDVKEDYGEVIPNLWNVFASRFRFTKKQWNKDFAKYLLVFERYNTKKE